jgi:hypothetical protein
MTMPHLHERLTTVGFILTYLGSFAAIMSADMPALKRFWSLIWPVTLGMAVVGLVLIVMARFVHSDHQRQHFSTSDKRHR